MINAEYMILCVIVGVITYVRGALDLLGSLLMVIMGLIIIFSAGFNWLILILIFLFLGFVFTQYEKDYKKEIGVYEGRRTAKNVISNGIVPFVMAATGNYAGFIGSIATATADTLASEVGVVDKPRLITTLRRVPPGTDGGISLLGTAAGIIGAGTIGFFAYFLGIHSNILVNLKIAVIAGTFGCFVDSILGATLERRNYITNEHVNLLSTIMGGLLGIFLV
ncbi:MAG: TIGR00297 family protein [Euryarchaeota archaeon]|nr:TIGR00297 family protein [Euryarchaeota archaeon]